MMPPMGCLAAHRVNAHRYTLAPPSQWVIELAYYSLYSFRGSPPTPTDHEHVLEGR